MKFLLKITILIDFLILLLPNVRCDLPIHCLKHDIVGKWKIKATKLYPVKNGHEMNCGHETPSREETSFMAVSKFPFVNEYHIQLNNIDSANIEYNGKILNGKWTMIYDEGFNIDFNEISFFAFSKYLITQNNFVKSYKSLCYSTCVGWYHNKDKTQWGCYVAEKVGKDPSEITYLNSKNMINILQPATSTVLEPMRFKSLSDKKTNKSNLKRSNTSFITIQDKIKNLILNENFNEHHLYVENHLNKVKKSWEASVHPDFSKMSIKQLNRFAGIQRNNINKAFKDLMKFREVEDISKFPKDFNWMNKLRSAGSQGNCGSCYAFATIRMIEARLKILYNEEVKLSVQHALDCSYYNQGCEGGYPFLVLKFGNDFELIPEDCKPYKGEDGKCSESCDISKIPYTYHIRDFQYIGGSYGQCSEKKMMEEIYKNGPIVVSFEPDYNFMMYKSGIYHAIDEETWLKRGLKKPEWQKVDHSVLLVGWGTDAKSGEKYWILQNTWGENWGENGFFRVRRGTDELSIESICESGTPVIYDNIRKIELIPHRNTIFESLMFTR